MSSINSVISITVNVERARIAQAGFGLPLILSHTASWAGGERVRSYEQMSEVLVDFAITTAEYQAADAIFGQDESPDSILIGRATSTITQRYAVTPVAVNSGIYRMTIVSPAGVSNTISVTADSSATVAEIITLLKNAIDALSLALTTSDQTTYLRILANTAGAVWGISVENVTMLGIKQDHDAPSSVTLATDLAAIIAENDSWYALVTLYNSQSYVLAAAAWVETSGLRYYSAASNDSSILTHVQDTGDHDTAEALYDLDYDRSNCFYHAYPSEFADAAFMGKWLPAPAGGETTKFLDLSGITPDVMTSTQRGIALGKRAMIFTELGDTGVSMTEEGKTASGRWIDQIRGIDWQSNLIGVGVANLLIARANAQSKVPYTQEGLAMLAGPIRGALDAGVRRGFYAKDPAPEVTMPLMANISQADKDARTVPDITASATLAGAVHSLEFTLSLST